MNTAEMIFPKSQALPESAQNAVLQVVEELALKYPLHSAKSLTLHEAAELRGKLAAWEEDWNAPGMEAYDRP